MSNNHHPQIAIIHNFVMKYFLERFFLFIILIIANTNLCLAQNEDNLTSKKNIKIIISGNERVEEETILNYFHDIDSESKLSEKLPIIKRNLLETELFSDIEIINNQSEIKVKVTENPIIYDTIFAGNKKIDDDVLSSETSLKKRSIFSKSKLQGDLKRINEIYIKSGRFLTQIEPKIIQKDNNRIELIFEIKEGPKAKIGEIYFIGNNQFSDRELGEQISTKKSIWWKFLSSSDIYDSDRVEYDKELLRRFYNNNGFADFTVISSMAQINRTKDNFFITFLLEEGIKYRIGEINLTNHVDKFDPEILRKHILFKNGEIYNAEKIEKTIDKMVEIMSEKSYAFANIEPILKRNRDKNTIDIELVINETPRIYIDKIKIFGNTRTLDEVIRRELKVREGDAYNINKINRSRQRLENLGYFEKVNFDTKRIGNSDLVDLEINVKEKRTGELSLGLGYSTVNRFNINTGIRENNLFGTGRKIGFNIQKSFASLSADLNYTKPYFLGRPLEAGFDVFKINSTKRFSQIYDSSNSGFRLNAGYSVTEFLNHIISYSYSAQNIGNIDSGASLATRTLQGNYIYSSIENTLYLDKTNNRLDPRSGYLISLTHSLTGVGGNVKNVRYTGKAGYFLPTINNEFVLKFLVRGGIVDGLGEDVRIQNNFFLGGNDFRGFQFYGIGPRALNGNNEAVGGKIYYVGTTEFRFPLGLPRELGISGAIFWDNGLVKGVDSSIKNSTTIIDTGKLRSSAGLSIFWSSPVGPIRLDFSKILKKQYYDRTQTFNFNIGTSF